MIWISLAAVLCTLIATLGWVARKSEEVKLEQQRTKTAMVQLLTVVLVETEIKSIDHATEIVKGLHTDSEWGAMFDPRKGKKPN